MWRLAFTNIPLNPNLKPGHELLSAYILPRRDTKIKTSARDFVTRNENLCNPTGFFSAFPWKNPFLYAVFQKFPIFFAISCRNKK